MDMAADTDYYKTGTLSCNGIIHVVRNYLYIDIVMKTYRKLQKVVITQNFKKIFLRFRVSTKACNYESKKFATSCVVFFHSVRLCC
jgi:hypothetical protein